MDNPQLYYSGGQLLQRSVLTETFMQYGLSAIDLIIWVTFAFMISTVFRNSALAIGISIFILFTSSPLLMFLRRLQLVKISSFCQYESCRLLWGRRTSCEGYDPILLHMDVSHLLCCFPSPGLVHI